MTYDIVNQPEQTREDGYWLHGLRLAIHSLNHDWRISIYVDNLTDSRYRTQVLTSTVGWGETWGMPRTLGITLDYSW